MRVTVGQVGAASGIRGAVRVQVRTDDVAGRFALGSVLETNNPDFPTLTVASASRSGKHFVVRFTQIVDRTQAEQLRGARLEIEIEEAPGSDDDGFYPSQLRGLTARHVNGQTLGTVKDLQLGGAQDLLIIDTGAAEVAGEVTGEVMVPFVRELVPEVDLEAGQVLLDPPGGLFPN